MDEKDAVARHWPELERLLDEGLTLPQDQRQAWLGSLRDIDDSARQLLRDLLDRAHRLEAAPFLVTMPRAEPLDAQEPVAGLEIGPYRLLRRLGSGGMGEVWQAERSDGLLKRTVALKLPRAAWGRSFAKRLERERDILASLEHPRIARLYDTGVDGQGRPFLALEYVDGQPIDVWCQRRRCTPQERVALLLQVGEAVAFAHTRLVVHRDLKPANILVSADGQVRLLDFGIAKLLANAAAEDAGPLTLEGGHPLTPEYASPEQLRDEPIGTPSDVYSLGVVAFELLAGGSPWRSEAGERSRAPDAEAPLASSAVNVPALKKFLRGDLDAILAKALQPALNARYPSVEAFMQDLQRFLRQEPVAARPDGWGYRARKLVQRHKLATGVAGASVLALLAGAYAQATVLLVMSGASLGAIALTVRAQRQAAVAQAQQARANRVKRLALSLFEQADPDAGATRGTSAADLLKSAHARITAELSHDAEVAVELLTVVGVGLVGQNELASALSVLEDAVARADARLGVGHPLTLAACAALGTVLMRLHRLDDAESALHRAIAGLRSAEGALASLADALTSLGYVRLFQARLSDAGALSAEALEVAEQLLLQGDPRPALRARELDVNVRRLSGASGLAESARALRALADRVYRGQSVVPAVEAAFFEAEAEVLEGDAEAGVHRFAQVLQQMERLYGPRHATTLHLPVSAATACSYRGLLSEALQWGQKAIAQLTKEGGDGSAYELASAHFHYAGTLLLLCAPEQAREHALLAAQLHAQVGGELGVNSLLCRALACTCDALCDPAAAVATHTDWWQQAAGRWASAQRPQRRRLEEMAGWFWLHTGDSAKAVAHLQEAQRLADPGASTRWLAEGRVQGGLGLALLPQDPAAALSHLETALASLRRYLRGPTADLLHLYRGAAAACKQLGQHQAAQGWARAARECEQGLARATPANATGSPVFVLPAAASSA